MGLFRALGLGFSELQAKRSCVMEVITRMSWQASEYPLASESPQASILAFFG